MSQMKELILLMKGWEKCHSSPITTKELSYVLYMLLNALDPHGFNEALDKLKKD